MTEPTPADTLRAAAARVRQTWPDLAPLAAWLDREARQEEYTLAEFGHRSACQEALDTARLCLAPQPHGPTAHAQRPQDATDGAPASPAASDGASGPQTGAEARAALDADDEWERSDAYRDSFGARLRETYRAAGVELPDPDPDPDPGDGLRERIAERLGLHPTGEACADCLAIADGVITVVQPRLDDAERRAKRAEGRLQIADAAYQEHLRDIAAADTLLRDAERYLRATHDGIRHDNLGADLSCAGCQLAAHIREALDGTDTPPTADVRTLPERDLHAAIRKMARIDPAWIRDLVRRAHLDDRPSTTAVVSRSHSTDTAKEQP